MRILIVDDEASVVELVHYHIKLHGLDADIAYNGNDAIKKLQQESFDLMILDQMLPGTSGIEVLKWVRANKDLSSLPVIMLTAKSDESDVVLALNFGADDYMSKPFRVHEMIARVKALLRRSSAGVPGGLRYQFEDFSIDEDTFEVIVQGKQVPFTTKEFRLLLYLIQNPNRVIRREQLLNDVWGYDYLGESRTVDVHILNVRKKIEPNPKKPKYLITIIGEGYKFVKEK